MNPKNPFDSRAIASVCKLKEEWEQIGYIVREALDEVHCAMDKNKIVAVKFDWVKFIVYFQNRGWYAGIMLTKKVNGLQLS